MHVKPKDREVLEQLASRYVWWKTPAQALEMPERVVAQVMDIGDYDDVQTLAKQLGDDVLRDVLAHAQAGQFGERSWAYWHLRLGLAPIDRMPPMPARKFT